MGLRPGRIGRLKERALIVDRLVLRNRRIIGKREVKSGSDVVDFGMVYGGESTIGNGRVNGRE